MPPYFCLEFKSILVLIILEKARPSLTGGSNSPDL
jgi:hypothetical protein